ncbi:hypothetical protein EYC84_000970 [Monilinia fructicola]|uniref:Uncharacterized protein n=1 Tax=Monilinia fructicola TaxID=38448 RepID=A0A5M9JIN3_MONFR|nr:hypothetical protein EYC84_000970 [Monilinia fructicola]
MSCSKATVEKWRVEIICRHQDATPNAILPEKKNKTCVRCISPCTCICTRLLLDRKTRREVVEAIKAKIEKWYKVYMQMKEAKAIVQKKPIAESRKPNA